MSETNSKKYLLADHPVLVIILALVAIVSCCVPTFIFVTGIQSLPELLSSSREPTQTPQEPAQVTHIQNNNIPIEETSEPALSGTSTITPSPIVPETVTPYPTLTSTLEPTAAVVVNTSPGSILDVGQSWRQDDLLLTLGEVNYNQNFPESACDISFSFYIENISSNTINLSVNPSQFQAVDNLGRQLQRAGFSQMSVCPAAHINEPFSGIVDPGKHFPASGFDYWQPGYTINLSDTAIDYIIVTVTGLYRFDNAKWRVPVYN